MAGRPRKAPPRRRNPPDDPVAGPVNAFLELVATEAETWALGQFRSSDRDILTLFLGNEKLHRAAALRAFANFLRTGELGKGYDTHWPDTPLPSSRELVGIYLTTNGDTLPLAMAVNRVASEAGAWSRLFRLAAHDDEGKALFAFARFLRSGFRPEWYVPLATED